MKNIYITSIILLKIPLPSIFNTPTNLKNFYSIHNPILIYVILKNFKKSFYYYEKIVRQIYYQNDIEFSKDLIECIETLCNIIKDLYNI